MGRSDRTYISIFLWILRTSTRVALAKTRRDPDAAKRASEDPNPKTGMLGVTPRSTSFFVLREASIVWRQCHKRTRSPFFVLHVLHQQIQESLQRKLRRDGLDKKPSHSAAHKPLRRKRVLTQLPVWIVGSPCNALWVYSDVPQRRSF